MNFLYNSWARKSRHIFCCFFCFFLSERALVLHNISVLKSKNGSSKWCTCTRMIISKMYSPLAEDHATRGWSADGWIPLQPWDVFDILHLSQRPVHIRGNAKYFCPPLSFLLCCPGPDRHVPKIKSHAFHWSTAVSCLEPVVCQHGSNQSVRLSIFPSTLCVLGVFYSALPPVKSTVAPGQSLGVGIGDRVSSGLRVCRKHTVVQDGWDSEDKRVCVRRSFLLGSASHHPHQTHKI